MNLDYTSIKRAVQKAAVVSTVLTAGGLSLLVEGCTTLKTKAEALPIGEEKPAQQTSQETPATGTTTPVPIISSIIAIPTTFTPVTIVASPPVPAFDIYSPQFATPTTHVVIRREVFHQWKGEVEKVTAQNKSLTATVKSMEQIVTDLQTDYSAIRPSFDAGIKLFEESRAKLPDNLDNRLNQLDANDKSYNQRIERLELRYPDTVTTGSIILNAMADLNHLQNENISVNKKLLAQQGTEFEKQKSKIAQLVSATAKLTEDNNSVKIDIASVNHKLETVKLETRTNTSNIQAQQDETSDIKRNMITTAQHPTAVAEYLQTQKLPGSGEKLDVYLNAKLTPIGRDMAIIATSTARAHKRIDQYTPLSPELIAALSDPNDTYVNAKAKMHVISNKLICAEKSIAAEILAREVLGKTVATLETRTAVSVTEELRPVLGVPFTFSVEPFASLPNLVQFTRDALNAFGRGEISHDAYTTLLRDVKKGIHKDISEYKKIN